MKTRSVVFAFLCVTILAFSSQVNAATHVVTIQCSDNAGHSDLQQARVQLIWNHNKLVSASLSSKFEVVQKTTAVYHVVNKSDVIGQDVTVIPEVVQTPKFDYGYFNEPIREVNFTSVGTTRVYALNWGGERAGSAKVIYRMSHPNVADVYWSINGMSSHIPVQTCTMDYK